MARSRSGRHVRPGGRSARASARAVRRLAASLRSAWTPPKRHGGRRRKHASLAELQSEMRAFAHVLAILWLPGYGLLSALEPRGYHVPATEPADHPVVAWSYRTPAYAIARTDRAQIERAA
jgi:hypothetical protein